MSSSCSRSDPSSTRIFRLTAVTTSRRAGRLGLLGLLLATSRTKFVAAVLAGAIAGVSGAFILALINIGLRPEGETANTALLFAAVCLVLVLARNASQTLLS